MASNYGRGRTHTPKVHKAGANGRPICGRAPASSAYVVKVDGLVDCGACLRRMVQPVHTSELPGSGMVYTPRAAKKPATDPAPASTCACPKPCATCDEIARAGEPVRERAEGYVPGTFNEARAALHTAAYRFAAPMPERDRVAYALALESAAVDFARYALRRADGACPVCDAPAGAACVDAEGVELPTRHADREGC